MEFILFQQKRTGNSGAFLLDNNIRYLHLIVNE